jgi:cell division septation protein DedD
MENRLKERLTGAAILVALIVMLVPEMFHGQRGDVAATAGSSGEGPPVRSYTIDLSNSPTRTGPLQSTPAGGGSGAAAATGGSSGNDDQPAGAAGSEQPTAPSAQATQGAAASSRPATQASSEPVAATPPTPAQGANAPATTKPAITAPATIAPATATPKVAVTAASGNSHQSPPATPSHSAPAGGWVVQLGLFAKRDNAERLAHNAQEQGFTVSVSNPDAKGLYRVYAGGMSERSAAEAYAQRLKDHGMPAAVLASP